MAKSSKYNPGWSALMIFIVVATAFTVYLELFKKDPAKETVASIPALTIFPFSDLGAAVQVDSLSLEMVHRIAALLSNYTDKELAISTVPWSAYDKSTYLDNPDEHSDKLFLKGTIRNKNDSLALTAVLTDALTGKVLWTASRVAANENRGAAVHAEFIANSVREFLEN